MPEHHDPKSDDARPDGGPSGHEVGTAGERFIEELWQLPFGRDFLFANPKYKKDGNEYELCDLLLLLDGTAVLVQIKTANPVTKQGWSEQQWADWGNDKIEEALGQMPERLEDLLDGRVPRVKNRRQGRVPINPKSLDTLYGIVVVDTPPMGHWGKPPVLEVRDRSVPVLVTSHQNMIEIVTELSTPMDLIEFLALQQRLFTRNEFHGASELDLLAGYKTEYASLDRAIEEGQTTVVLPGSWARYTSTEKRQQRARLDRNSFIVDAMIDKLASIRIAEPEFVYEMREEEGQPNPGKADKQAAINELARLDRVSRRMIGDRLIEKTRLCLQTGRNRHFCFRSPSDDSTWHVFVVSQAERRERLRYVGAACQGLILSQGVGNVFGYGLPPVRAGFEFSMDAAWYSVDPKEFAKHIGEDLVEQSRRYWSEPIEVEHTEFGGPENPASES